MGFWNDDGAGGIDNYGQLLAANVVGAGDVVVAISGSGKIAELLKAVDTAIAAGAAVIAITPSHAPLAQKASVTIAIDHPEDVALHMPMISRVIDCDRDASFLHGRYAAYVIDLLL